MQLLLSNLSALADTTFAIIVETIKKQQEIKLILLTISLVNRSMGKMV
jgi:hypothetical protein